jgi:hypothetical protein
MRTGVIVKIVAEKIKLATSGYAPITTEGVSGALKLLRRVT